MNDYDRFPHLDDAGRARMVDVGDKAVTRRRARAEGSIRMDRETLRAILDRTVEKGDVLAVARIAAVGGAKQTSNLVPTGAIWNVSVPSFQEIVV